MARCLASAPARPCSEDATNKDALDEEKQRRRHVLRRNLSSAEDMLRRRAALFVFVSFQLLLWLFWCAAPQPVQG